MRITLDIDEDVLRAAGERAQRECRTTGQVVSELLRQALSAPQRSVASEPRAVHGILPFDSRGGVVTNELIDQLRCGDAY